MSKKPDGVRGRELGPATFQGLCSTSQRATAAARGSSRKAGTKCELVLQRALAARECQFLANVAGLLGCPDIAFPHARLVVFCDGDFWHGRDWKERKLKLLAGANANYWVTKIRSNIDRDWRVTRAYLDAGWTVLRFWESEVRKEPDHVAQIVASVLARQANSRPPRLDSTPLRGVNRA